MARLVFCEDDPTIQKLIRVALRTTAHEVHVAPDGLAGLALIERVRPDLVFTDLSMPVMDGHQLLREIKARPELASTPVVLFTAGRADELDRDVAAAACDVLAKPFSTGLLREKVEQLLEAGRGAEPHELRQAAAPEQRDSVREDPAPPSELAPVWDEFVAASRARVGALEDAVAALLRGVLEPGQRDAAEQDAHRLAGSLGSFGVSEGSRLAREAEELMRAPVAVGRVPRLASLTIELRRAIEEARPPAAAGATLAEPGSHQLTIDAPAAQQPGRTVDVVVVDDDEPLAHLLLHALGTRGYTTEWLNSGTDAVEALTGDAPALRGRVILLDVNLPGLDGIGVLRHLAHEGHVAGTRVIMLTARSSEAEVLETFELGASDHVAKPFSVPVLVQRIRHALEG